MDCLHGISGAEKPMHRTILCLIVILTFVVPGFSWGRRGHSLATRVATAALPHEMPAFFREAGERLAYQASEPDRWRHPSAPALTNATTRDHGFKVETWGTERFPPTRGDLVLAASKRGLIKDADPVGAFHSGPVGATELAERLVLDLRFWREATSETEAERQVRRQLEDNVLYTAGVLAHYVTDVSNPLHASVHSGGWARGVPNPGGFAPPPADGIHGRFESLFVQDVITERDVAERLTPARRVGPWPRELEQHTRRSNSSVAPVYELDKREPFGSGREPAEARAFTAARLAEGASMLRDIWYTAWLLSGEQWLNEPVSYIGRNARTVLEQLQELHEVEPRHHIETRRENGRLRVVRIDNRKEGLDGRQWRCYINGKLVTTPVDKQVTAVNDRVEWRFERTAAN